LTLVVDASVAVKWVVTEIDTPEAVALQTSSEDLIAPDLVVAEIASATWKRFRCNEFSQEQALRAITIAPGLLTRLYPILGFTKQALTLAIDLGHPVYDCFYLALALREDATLITADERMFAAARKAKIKVKRL
jgi:predicted nucleic acid-binding protein